MVGDVVPPCSVAREPRAIGLIRAVLEGGGRLELAAGGHSMYPAILHGDVLTVVRPDASALTVGCVVLIHRGDSLVAHRVVAKTCDRLVTRGDACELDDAEISDSDVVGLVTGSRSRPGGRWRAFVARAWSRLRSRGGQRGSSTA